MVAVPAVLTVEEWLYARLSAAVAPIPVHSGAAPENTSYPVCVFAFLDSVDTNSVGGPEQRVMTRFDYVVRITDHTESFLTISALAAVADQALQAQKGPSGLGGTVLSCARTEPFVQRETDPVGVTYLSLGGVYRIFVQEGGP